MASRIESIGFTSFSRHMSSRAQQEHEAILGALAVFDDNQNGSPHAWFLLNSFSSQSPSGQIDRAQLRKILIGTGHGLASTQDVDIFMRLLPQGSGVSFQSIAQVQQEFVGLRITVILTNL